MLHSPFLSVVVLFLSVLLAVPHAAGVEPRGGWKPEVQRLEEVLSALQDSGAAITVDVDPAACVTGPTQCSEFTASPAASNNRNPVRLTVQILTSETADGLTLASFDLQTQFSPSGEGVIEPLVCPECFEGREGGTYAIWIVPEDGNWESGLYYVLVRATVNGAILPALARIAIPVEPNEPPRAAVSVFPPTEGQVGVPVTFDGSASLDPDGEISCFQWQLLSDNPDPFTSANPEIVQGMATPVVTRTFQNQQALAVTLLVSDRTDIACVEVNATSPVGEIEPRESFSPFSFTTGYTVGCRNPAPTAVIAGADVINALGSPATLTSVTLDGTLSFDGETALERWIWTCGNDQSPIPVTPDGSVVVCRFRPGTYTATLNVTDRGTGRIDPATGTWECHRASDADTVTVNIMTF